jgi:MFS family permease
MPQLRTEFGLTATQLALLNSVFFWIYAVTAFLAGRLGDSARRTRVIVYGLIFWSVATGFSSLANGFAMLLAFRGLVAFGEAFYYPTATALISDWHRPAMRSRALSIHQTAVLGGAGLGALFAGLLADRLGWRSRYSAPRASSTRWS